VGQGGQGRHPPIGPASGPQQSSGWGQGRAGQGRGRAGQGNCYGGPREVPFLLKKSLGKTGGPASNQTKIQFKKKLFSL